MKSISSFIALSVFIFLFSGLADAGGECPMHSTMATAATSDGKLALQAQYEYTFMRTLREGSSSVTPDEVLDEKMSDPTTMKYSVPTEMVMRKYTFTANYAPMEKLQFMLAVPYAVNDMDMRMAMRMGMMVTKSNSTMNTVEGLGDVSLMGIYNLYSDAPVKPTKSISIGLGIKMPTGKNDERSSSGGLIHASMQPGSGSWDPMLLVNAVHYMKPVSFQFNGMYHLTTKGDEGYEFGDMIGADITARYRVIDSVNLGLGLNFIHTAKDKDHDNKYSKPATSLIDNTENTGITAFYLSPEIQLKFLNTGGSLSLRFQKPIYQHVNGIQQVVDWRVVTSLMWTF